MFTGIIQESGIIKRSGSSGNIYRLDILSKDICKDVAVGGSVSVNGVCLTVTGKKKDALSFDVMAETIRRTSLAGLKSGDKVNLEGSLKANGAVDGHFVMGHVDCIGTVKNISREGDEFVITIGFPGEFGDLTVEKGSIAVDGVSLTIGRRGENAIDVYLIPHTLRSTTLSAKKAGDAVNLEFDILGKYARRQRWPASKSRISEKFLRDNGF